ncbi:MAG: hypothetical protein IID40_09780, partial [Planctomycetes bacterium]|nr:hypothetical protein [Planctomycetota bacterium]
MANTNDQKATTVHGVQSASRPTGGYTSSDRTDLETRMSDASADDRATTPPRRRWHRWRRWCLIAAALLVGVWFARFAYLRLTRRPTPRPEYWIAKIAELDPPPVGAVSAAEAQRILIAAPWITDAASKARFDFNVLDVLAGAWDPTRIDISKVDAVFRTQAFIDARARVRRLARAGWMSPPEIEFETRFALPYRRWRWSSLLTVHSRWVREQNGDLDTCVDDWLSALQLARQLRRSRQVETWRSALSATSTVVWEMWAAAGELRTPLDVRSLALEIDEICGPVLRPSDLLAGERLAMHADLERWFVRDGGQ